MFNKQAVISRFKSYAEIDTQSDPNSEAAPSTEKQKNLSKKLVAELQEMGIQDAHLDEYGVVYATLQSNSSKNVPVICFCSHVDTSPDCTGENVKPIVHANYDGKDIVLPADSTQVIKMTEHPDLSQQIGNDIITADGTTLLGADNKAGVAAIMEAVKYLKENPEHKHGAIKILFTPDEEIGRGVNNVSIEKLGAQFGYTIDGESLGTLEDETFSADYASLEVYGVSTHPGFAKGKMESSLKIVSEIIASLPKSTLSPESTSGMEGFIHPVSVNGILEKTVAGFILRDFTEEGLKSNAAVLKSIADEVMKNYPNSEYKLLIKEQYRNMKSVLDKHPQVSQYVLDAMKRSGLTPERRSIRGGTDGSRLSYMGLPCPNIFAGEHAFHSKLEWVSAQDMMKAAETIVNLAIIWEENAS